MDKIILLTLFSIIGSVTKGNAQLSCFVCSNCPNGHELDRNLIRSCGTPDVTIDPPETTTPEEEDTTTSTPPTVPTDPTVTETPPNSPPTTTAQTPTDPATTTQTTDGGVPTVPVSPPTTTEQVPVIPIQMLGPKLRHIMQGQVGEYQCFVVRQQVGNEMHLNRGCVITQSTEQQTCLDAAGGEEPAFCDLCATDECNTADHTEESSATKYSLSLAQRTI
ncbi:hypothetical protein Bhyg_02266, partial [Pseudolycoriella hygida]